MRKGAHLGMSQHVLKMVLITYCWRMEMAIKTLAADAVARLDSMRSLLRSTLRSTTVKAAKLARQTRTKRR